MTTKDEAEKAETERSPFSSCMFCYVATGERPGNVIAYRGLFCICDDCMKKPENLEFVHERIAQLKKINPEFVKRFRLEDADLWEREGNVRLYTR